MRSVGRRRLVSRAAAALAVSGVALALALAGAGVLTEWAAAGEDGQTPAPQPADTGGPTLPEAGVVHFGETLGGVGLAMSRADVRTVWGSRFGTCRDCENETWYFTYEEFSPEGAGVEFGPDGVQAVFTLWQPDGWRSAGGLRLGTPRDEIPQAYLELERVECAGYEAYVHGRFFARTALYVHEDSLWAYAVLDVAEPVCR